MLGLAVFFLCGFAVTNMPQFLAGALLYAGVGVICSGADRKKRRAGGALGTQIPLVRLFGPALAAACCFLMPPISMESGALWKYPIHRTILGIYKNVQPPALFPDFTDDVISDYHFSYLPSLMQGTGHYSVRFVTDQERLDSYLDGFLEHMDTACLLSDIDGFTLPVSDAAAYTIWYDREFFADCPDAGVIICESGTDPNHPHSTAIILDRATGRVQLSRLG